MRQLKLLTVHWKHHFCYGGELRKSRQGRGARPLSTKLPIHLVLKAAKTGLRKHATYTLINQVLNQYSRRFYVKIEQWSIQNDHIHLLIRVTKRSQFAKFFRVVAGQIAQRVTDTFHQRAEEKFWKHRPFTRVVEGWKAYKIVMDYIQLNEKEATNEIKYSKTRLRGLSPEQLQCLWS